MGLLVPSAARTVAASSLSTFLALFGGFSLLTFAFIAYRWRREAKRKLAGLRDAVPPLLMKRVPLTEEEQKGLESNPINALAWELSLSDGYKELMKRRGIEVMSLGEYLSSLRPVGPTRALEDDLELILGAAMVRVLGPSLGPAFLPVLNALPRMVGKLAGIGGIALAAASAAESGGKDGDVKRDNRGDKKQGTVADVAISTPAAIVRAVGGMSILAMAGAADVGAAVVRARKQRSKTKMRENSVESDDGGDKADPLFIMRRGESAAQTFPDGSLPNPFILSSDWKRAIGEMEKEILSKDVAYNPDAYPMSEATPVNDPLLPDLHLGVGGIPRTHNNREILNSRLLCILLNKLNGNFLLLDESTKNKDETGSPLFVVKLEPNGTELTQPDELIECLKSTDHQVRASFATRTTTFGFRLCVRESSGQKASEKKTETTLDDAPRWIHIPLGFFLRTGLQDENGGSISTFLTHGSMEVDVRGGPVISNALVQYYHSQEGFDGWCQGDYPNAPWCVDAAERPIKSYELSRAVRMAGLLACCENVVGSELDLPAGGYGLTGACTDSVAVVEQGLIGRTGIYPILGIGGYKLHVLRKAKQLLSAFEGKSAEKENAVPKDVISDMQRLIKALTKVPNDVHPTPATVADAARRIHESCVPANPPFALMEELESTLKPLLKY